MKNQGKWSVSSQVLGDTRKYAVYRLRDVHAVDHNGNREWDGRGYTANRQDAVDWADELNAQEEPC